jgi:hypothetical protein
MIKKYVDGKEVEITPAEDQALRKAVKGVSYVQKRIMDYPRIGDQLDTIMKWAMTADLGEGGSDLKQIAAACMAVKDKYPKDETS